MKLLRVLDFIDCLRSPVPERFPWMLYPILPAVFPVFFPVRFPVSALVFDVFQIQRMVIRCST